MSHEFLDQLEWGMNLLDAPFPVAQAPQVSFSVAPVNASAAPPVAAAAAAAAAGPPQAKIKYRKKEDRVPHGYLQTLSPEEFRKYKLAQMSAYNHAKRGPPKRSYAPRATPDGKSPQQRYLGKPEVRAREAARAKKKRAEAKAAKAASAAAQGPAQPRPQACHARL